MPTGYELDYGDADVVVLIGPSGPTGHRYTPSTPTQQIIEDAWEHWKKAYICDDPECWVCDEKRSA